MNKKDVFCFFIVILCLFAIIGLIIYGVIINYHYEKEIGAYFDNSEDCITPNCILTQLKLGYEAINNSGLTENDYGAWIFKKPDNSMKFQYQHLDAIIERAEAVQNWVDKVYANNTQGETMKDVYTEKMDNLRKYITQEYSRSDWIAKNSWYFKYHFFYTILAFWVKLFLGTLIVICVIFYFTAENKDADGWTI